MEHVYILFQISSYFAYLAYYLSVTSLGCWLIYKVPDGQLYGLESYDLMSANDVPERDPMDWYDYIILLCLPLLYKNTAE